MKLFKPQLLLRAGRHGDLPGVRAEAGGLVSWDLIEAFLLVCEAGSIDRAADLSGLSPQELERRLNRLEADLQIELILRSSDQIELTDAGETLFEQTQGIPAAIEEAVRKVQERQPLSGA